MSIKKCRILAAPIHPEDERSSELWLYRAPESLASAVGLSILFSKGWDPAMSCSLVQTLDEERGVWVRSQADSFDAETQGETVTQKRIHSIAPDLLAAIPSATRPR